MRILLVKTSSLGDVIHNLPVVGDIRRRHPDAQIDWLVEENYAPIPRLHPAVARVIPLAWRRWRKRLATPAAWREMAQFRGILREREYDWIIDTQGLLKSAVAARLARGRVAGGCAPGLREPLAGRFYHRCVEVEYAQHAVDYCRAIAAGVLGHGVEVPEDFGIHADPLVAAWLPRQDYAVLLHSAGHASKLWQEAAWQALAAALSAAGLSIVLPWGAGEERDRATRLAAACRGALVAPALGLAEMAGLLAGARLVVGLDTGLVHLSAALGRPTMAIYIRPFDLVRARLRGAAPHVNLGDGRAPPTAPEAIRAAETLLGR